MLDRFQSLFPAGFSYLVDSAGGRFTTPHGCPFCDYKRTDLSWQMVRTGWEDPQQVGVEENSQNIWIYQHAAHAASR